MPEGVPLKVCGKNKQGPLGLSLQAQRDLGPDLLTSDEFALGFIQAILNIVPISDLWYSWLLNQIYGFGESPLPRRLFSGHPPF